MHAEVSTGEGCTCTEVNGVRVIDTQEWPREGKNAGKADWERQVIERAQILEINCWWGEGQIWERAQKSQGRSQKEGGWNLSSQGRGSKEDSRTQTLLKRRKHNRSKSVKRQK